MLPPVRSTAESKFKIAIQNLSYSIDIPSRIEELTQEGSPRLISAISSGSFGGQTGGNQDQGDTGSPADGILIQVSSAAKLAQSSALSNAQDDATSASGVSATTYPSSFPIGGRGRLRNLAVELSPGGVSNQRARDGDISSKTTVLHNDRVKVQQSIDSYDIENTFTFREGGIQLQGTSDHAEYRFYIGDYDDDQEYQDRVLKLLAAPIGELINLEKYQVEDVILLPFIVRSAAANFGGNSEGNTNDNEISNFGGREHRGS
ncbi:hypothetical protein TWF506_004343 [Arthrobotrys conoides]|uniref:Uncharacterized protein n=1 Tax=Arthrobotrys conoides TaxID=74498 RepID=A0AAN8NA67_9PEZI